MDNRANNILRPSYSVPKDQSETVSRQLFERADRGGSQIAPIHLDRAQRLLWAAIRNTSLAKGLMSLVGDNLVLSASGHAMLAAMRKRRLKAGGS